MLIRKNSNTVLDPLIEIDECEVSVLLDALAGLIEAAFWAQFDFFAFNTPGTVFSPDTVATSIWLYRMGVFVAIGDKCFSSSFKPFRTTLRTKFVDKIGDWCWCSYHGFSGRLADTTWNSNLNFTKQNLYLPRKLFNFIWYTQKLIN